MATVSQGSGKPYIWFVVPVMPGLWSQIWSFLRGGHGTYTIVKTIEGNPLYDQYEQQGFPQYPTYAAAVAGAKAITAQAKANTTPPYIPGGLTPGDAAATNVNVSLSDLLGPLFQAHIWVRAGEFLVGAVLVGIGLNAMLKGKPLQVITGAAGKAGKAVMTV